MSRGYFITGTETDVGKTYVTAQLVKHLRHKGWNAGYYKPALSGAEWNGRAWIPGDADFVCRTAGLEVLPQSLVSYIYQTAVSPHLAARLEGNPLCMEKVVKHVKQLQVVFDFLCVEGSGGIVCPIRDDEDEQIMQVDFVKRFGLPLLVVSDSKLGSINRAVLTVSYAEIQGLEVRGIILNRYDHQDFMHRDNWLQIERLTGVPIVGVIHKEKGELEIIDEACFPNKGGEV